MKINKKIALIFSSILLLFAVLLIIFDNLLLNKYYEYQAEKNLSKIYSSITEFIESNSINDLSNPSIISNIYRIADDGGATSYVFDSSGVNVDPFNKQIFSVNDIFRNNNIDISEEGFSFKFVFENSIGRKKNNEQDTNIAYIGKTSKNGSVLGYVLIYMPESAMNESTSTFNAFILYITAILLILSIIASSLISNKLAKPLKEAEAKTKKMASLDFSDKLDISTNDEIGSLSVSINKMSDELERSINELKEANAKLEDDIKLKERVNKLREEFISDVSHELKTPISIIGGYSEALKLEGLSQDDINSYADIIIDESMRMNKLVKDLLKFTQIESGFLKLESEDFNLNEMVESIIKPLDLKLKEKQVNLLVKLNDIIVNGDYDMMSTVFNNLFTNAINHVDYDRNIVVSGEYVDSKYRIMVFNNGDNIKDENLDRIWDSFYKEDKSRSRSYGGSGLGLSIVKSIMESYNNSYGVKNMDNGVMFYFDMDLGK